jgi:hypothetical protein
MPLWVGEPHTGPLHPLAPSAAHWLIFNTLFITRHSSSSGNIEELGSRVVRCHVLLQKAWDLGQRRLGQGGEDVPGQE